MANWFDAYRQQRGYGGLGGLGGTRSQTPTSQRSPQSYNWMQRGGQGQSMMGPSTGPAKSFSNAPMAAAPNPLDELLTLPSFLANGQPVGTPAISATPQLQGNSQMMQARMGGLGNLGGMQMNPQIQQVLQMLRSRFGGR